MVTGICRYTKGEFNQDALDEVWNKGKETFKDPVSPPSSGIVYMTSDDIWDEYQGWHDHCPLACNQNTGQIREVSMKSIGPQGFSHSADFDTWQQLTPWCETEVASTHDSCQPPRSAEMSKSTNTAIMLGKSHCYMKYDGVWELRVKQTFDKAQWQPGYIKRGECILDSDRLSEEETEDYKWFGSNGEAIFSLNTWGNWWHPYPKGGNRQFWKDQDSNGNWRSPDAIAHIFYARLTLIKPESPETPDDRDSSAFMIHTSADKYIKENPDGSTDLKPGTATDCRANPLHCNDWDIGISKFKTVTNDWQMFCALAPNIELRHPNYGMGTSNILSILTKEDFDFYFADMPIPTTPL